MSRAIILNRLLEKYENSSHLANPGASRKRVMLRVTNGDLPEYEYQNAEVRDEYHQIAQEMEKKGLISLDWFPHRPVISAFVLNLDRVADCYAEAGRTHPGKLAAKVEQLVAEQLSAATTEWVQAWRDAVCMEAEDACRVPSICKNGLENMERLLTAMREYDALHGGAITMRGFSSRCFQDTELFEKAVRDPFLRAAVKHHAELRAISELEEFEPQEQLAYLGIYARPEHYEMSGKCRLLTASGVIDFAAAIPYGLALPGAAVDIVQAADLKEIRRVTFIENRPNYDAYLRLERQDDELTVCQGGLLDPQQKKLFRKLKEGLPETAELRFWADIDLGGFWMFSQLQQLFPQLKPLRMSAAEVEAYHALGLARTKKYLAKLRGAIERGEFPVFREAAEAILKYGVTIEQKVFLD